MIEKRLLKKINFIEIYQFFGGVLGIIVTFYVYYSNDMSNFNTIFDYISLVSPFLFFIICIYSGILLNQKKYRKGIQLVLITTFLQLFSFEIYNLYFTSINGIGIKFTFDFTKDIIVGLDFHFSQFFFKINQNSENFILKINLIALIILYLIIDIYRGLKDKNKD